MIIFCLILKINFLKFSSTEEIFKIPMKISMTRSNKFNTNKLARVFTYEENGKNKHYLLKSQKFVILRIKMLSRIFLIYIFFRNLSILMT